MELLSATLFCSPRGVLQETSPTFFLNTIVFTSKITRTWRDGGGWWTWLVDRDALQFRIADRVMHCSWVGLCTAAGLVLTLSHVIPMGGVTLHQQRGPCARRAGPGRTLCRHRKAVSHSETGIPSLYVK
eukprot:1122854-Prymnesium_polylepis.1